MKEKQIEIAKNPWGIEWKALGPFHLAPRERARTFVPGDEAVLRADERTYHSELTSNGLVKWRESKSQGQNVEDSAADVNWDLLEQEHGRAGYLSLTYFYTDIFLDHDQILVLKLKQVPELYVNGELWFGESYEYEGFKIAVPFKSGLNSILLKVPSYGPARFSFEIESPHTSVSLQPGSVTPHLTECPKKYWIGLPLLNQTNEWIRNLSAVDSSGRSTFQAESIDLPPLSTQVLKASWTCEKKLDEGSQSIPVLIRSNGVELLTHSIKLENRKATQDQIHSFISKHDRSVQYYAVRPPLKDLKANAGLILALHGANVDAAVVLGTYAPKDEYFIVAPTNRGRHGFGWQTLGRLDALEVLEEVSKIYSIDPDRVFVSGHSMGGQGAWHMAAQHPDRFAALVPAAAWTSFDRYVASYLGVSNLAIDPVEESFFNRASASSDNLRLIRNVSNLPVFGIQANMDPVVPPYHQRLYQRLLTQEGGAMELFEIQSRNHWCQNELAASSTGFACVDPAQAQKVYQSNRRNLWPEKLNLRFFDLISNDSFYWLKVLGQEQIFTDSQIKADYGNERIRIDSKNIEGLEIQIKPGTNPKEIIWNGKTIKVSGTTSNSIRVGKQTTKRSGDNYGGADSILAKPSVILYQDAADLKNALLYNHAYHRAANASLPIISLDNATSDDLKQSNLIIFSSWNHPRTQELFRKSPFKLSANAIRTTTEEIKGRLGFVSTFPNPWNKERLALSFISTDSSIKDSMLFFRPFAGRSGLQIPDFMIFDRSVTTELRGGIRMAGYYSNQWDLSNRDYFVR